MSFLQKKVDLMFDILTSKFPETVSQLSELMNKNKGDEKTEKK